MKHERKVLLTGATGFVGGEVLRRLLAEDDRRVVCLVRAADRRAAYERGRQTLRALFGEARPEHVARTEWVPADLEKRGLGLPRTLRKQLVRGVEEAIHCAASVRFDHELEEARRINVKGLQQVHALCRLARRGGAFRRLVHVSTAYTAGEARGAVTGDDLPGEGDVRFRNTYEQTKAEAERWLRAQGGDVPWTVCRPSIVVGDRRRGRTSNWNVVYVPMRLMAWGRLPYMPAAGRQLVDCVPVDFVADGILALGRRGDTAFGTFHLTAGDDALTVRDVVEQTYAGVGRREGREVPPRTRLLGRASHWLLATATRLVAGEKTRRALDSFSVYTAYTRVDAEFAMDRERAILAEEGLEWTPTAEWFPRVVDYALAANFGRAPRRERSAPARASAIAELPARASAIAELALGGSASGRLAAAV